MNKKINNFKLNKNEILRGADKFSKLFKYGNKISGHFVSIIFIKSDSKKIGFVVTKKVSNAVVRNRFKRILREIYRLNRDKFPENYHIIIYSKGTNDNFWVLQNEILQLLNRINYI